MDIDQYQAYLNEAVDLFIDGAIKTGMRNRLPPDQALPLIKTTLERAALAASYATKVILKK